MQRTSRVGEVGAAARGQPDQTANSGNDSQKSAYYLSNSQDPAPVIDRLLALAERDFGNLDRAGAYLDSSTIVYGDGGAHITALDEHIVAALFILHLRQLKAKHQRELQVEQRRAAIRLYDAAGGAN